MRKLRVSRTRTRATRRGQALVETAISIVVLLLLTFSVVDGAVLYFAYLTLENAVTEATRYAVTNQQMDDLSRDESIKLVMRRFAVGLTIPDSEIAFYNVSKGTPDSGGPRDIIQVQVAHPWQLMSPLLWPLTAGTSGRFNLNVHATMRNEPPP